MGGKQTPALRAIGGKKSGGVPKAGSAFGSGVTKLTPKNATASATPAGSSSQPRSNPLAARGSAQNSQPAVPTKVGRGGRSGKK